MKDTYSDLFEKGWGRSPLQIICDEGPVHSPLVCRSSVDQSTFTGANMSPVSVFEVLESALNKFERYRDEPHHPVYPVVTWSKVNPSKMRELTSPSYTGNLRCLPGFYERFAHYHDSLFGVNMMVSFLVAPSVPDLIARKKALFVDLVDACYTVMADNDSALDAHIECLAQQGKRPPREGESAMKTVLRNSTEVTGKHVEFASILQILFEIGIGYEGMCKLAKLSADDAPIQKGVYTPAQVNAVGRDNAVQLAEFNFSKVMQAWKWFSDLTAADMHFAAANHVKVAERPRPVVPAASKPAKLKGLESLAVLKKS